MRRRTLVFSALASAGLCAVPRVQASSGLAGDLATFSEQVAQTVALVTEAAATTQQVINTVEQGLQNLKNKVLQFAQPYTDLYKRFEGAYDGLRVTLLDTQGSLQSTKTMIMGYLSGAQAVKLSLREYLQKERDLAQRRGNEYHGRIAQDVAVINDLSAKATRLGAMSAKAQGIVGNLEGLALLNQQLNMAVGELMDLKTAVLQGNIDRNKQKVLDEASAATSAQLRADTAAAAKARFDRNQSLQVNLPAPWSNAMRIVPNATLPVAPVASPPAPASSSPMSGLLILVPTP